ncbi:MAG: oxidoreductase [Paenibacillaceae bacterium]|jgi:predicted dehydrogenase|nr:oxidoreductase [Paenibacillaceae bacterium]
MDKITFAIVGGGWRSEFYLRIAAALPDRFHVAGVLLRDPQKRLALSHRWNVRAYTDISELEGDWSVDFTVLTVSKTAAPEWITGLTERGIAVLAETPPAPDADSLRLLRRSLSPEARIQVAEQYPLQPLHHARTALIRAGKIGEPVHVQASVAHGYHGISLIRQWLGHQGAVPCTISGQRLVSSVLEGRVRDKLPEAERLKESTQDLALFQFDNGQSAVLDFTYDQYFSPIRRNRLLIRGTRGEIRDSCVDYMADFRTAFSGVLQRVMTGGEGSLEPLSLEGVLWGEQWLYRNPFHPVPLTDEELAIAELLLRMGQYAKGETGAAYSFQEAAVDTELAFCMEQALATRAPVRFEA